MEIRNRIKTLVDQDTFLKSPLEETEDIKQRIKLDRARDRVSGNLKDKYKPTKSGFFFHRNVENSQSQSRPRKYRNVMSAEFEALNIPASFARRNTITIDLFNKR